MILGKKHSISDSRTENLDALGRESGLPVLHDLLPEYIDPSLVDGLPVQWARDRSVLPIRIDGAVKLLVSDPGRPDSLHYAEMVTGVEMEPMLADSESIRSAIGRCYARRSEGADVARKDRAVLNGKADISESLSEDLLSDDAAPVARVINQIVLKAVESGASDIHFEPDPGMLRVRYRIDGRLYAQASPPLYMKESMISRLKVMARMDISERRLPQDGMAQVRVGDQAIDIRLSTVPIADGERVVLRLLNREQAYLSLGLFLH